MHLNAAGGIVYALDSDEMHRAEKADLITLPTSVEGTNCFNCKYIANKTRGVGKCKHPQVEQVVSDRMCCALWDAKGSIRPWK